MVETQSSGEIWLAVVVAGRLQVRVVGEAAALARLPAQLFVVRRRLRRFGQRAPARPPPRPPPSQTALRFKGTQIGAGQLDLEAIISIILLFEALIENKILY